MKIFTKKNFLIYLIVFLLTFSSVQIIQKKHFGFVYEIHNLCFVYDTCVNYNLDCKKLEEIIPLIQTSEYTGCLTEHIDTSNNELNKRVLSLFSQTLLEHHKFIITKNIKFFEYKPNNKDFLGINMKENPIISEGLLSDIGVKLPDSNFTYDIISKLAYFSDNYFCNNYLKVFYNFYIQYLLLVFVLIYGLLKKQNFFILQFFIHNTILLTALLTMPFYRYFYTYTFSFNTWILFFIILISILGKQKKE